MKSENKKTGNLGEDLACRFLEKKGFLIQERNYRTQQGEIDIVCWDAQILVFVEVKTKIGHDFGEPEEMVGKRKLAQVRRLGEIFVEKNRFEVLRRWGGQCRVDVVAIVLEEDGEVERLNHYQAVY